MAEFAKLGLNSKVLSVHMIKDELAPTEEEGIKVLMDLHNNYPFWKQSFPKDSGNARKNEATKGATYDEDRDAFIRKQPFPSWTLNEDTCIWEPPTSYPDDDLNYGWHEASKQWKRPDQF